MKPTRAYIENMIANGEKLNFEGWDLADLDLSGLDLYGAIFSEGASELYKNLNLSGANIRWAFGPDNPEVLLEYADLSGMTWYKGRIESRSFKGANFSKADFDEVDASTNIMSLIKAENATIVSTTFEGCDLRNADLSNSNLGSCDFRGANLQDANLARSDFNDSDFRGSVLRNVNFTSADLSEAKFQRADLTGADLTGANLEGAFYSTKTKWPEDFTDYLELCLLDPDFIADFDDDAFSDQDMFFLRGEFGPGAHVSSKPQIFFSEEMPLILTTDRNLDREIIFSEDGTLFKTQGGENPPTTWQIKPAEEFQDSFAQITSPIPNFVPAPDTASRFALSDREVSAGNADFVVDVMPSSTQYGAATLRLTRNGQSVELDGHHNSPISAIAISPDGSLIGSGDCGGWLKIWSVAAKKEVASLFTWGGLLRTLAFSPDNEVLLAGNEGFYRNQGMLGEDKFEENNAQGVIFVVDVAKKEFVKGLVAGGSPVRKIAFHPNGNFAVSLNGSSVVVWRRKK